MMRKRGCQPHPWNAEGVEGEETGEGALFLLVYNPTYDMVGMEEIMLQ